MTKISLEWVTEITSSTAQVILWIKIVRRFSKYETILFDDFHYEINLQMWNQSKFILFASPIGLQFLSSWNSIPSKSILHHGLWIGSCQNVLVSVQLKRFFMLLLHKQVYFFYWVCTMIKLNISQQIELRERPGF